MKKLCASGFKISSADKKALEHYLLIPAQQWASDALKGMINKSIKLIMREWFEEYKKTKTGDIDPNYSVIIPEIIAMEGFKMSKISTPKAVVVNRTAPRSEEIWANGFDLQDFEEMAIKAVYEDPEAMLNWFMENKIYQRRKAFLKEHESKFIKEQKAFPSNEDGFIDFAVAQPGYKNRVQAEAEMV